MIYLIYSFLYGERFIITVAIVIIFAILMGVLCSKVREKNSSTDRIMRIITIAAIALTLAAILYVTIIIRLPSNGERSEIVFEAFSSLKAGLKNPERFRIFAANILLFVPFGSCLMSYRYLIIQESWKKALSVTFIIGLILSFAIEATQYFLALGYVELDDIICNTLGTAVGALLWVFGRKVTFSIKSRINR